MLRKRARTRRIRGALLALGCCLALCWPAFGGAVADIAMPEGVYVDSAAVFDGALYLGSGGQIHRYAPGGQATTLAFDLYDLSFAWPDDQLPGQPLLAAGEAGLWLLDLFQGCVHSLHRHPEPRLLSSVKLDLSSLKEDGEFMQPPAQILVFEGRLYLLALHYGPGRALREVHSFDLEQGGQPQKHALPDALQLSPYQPGQLLALTLDDEGLGEAQVQVYDVAADSLSPLFVADYPADPFQAGLAWDEAADAFYILSRDAVYLFDREGRGQPCAYLLPGDGSGLLGRLWLLNSEQVAVVSPGTLSLRGTDPDKLSAPRLVIYGGGPDETHRAAMRSMAGVSVTFTSDLYYPSAQALGQAMLSGDDSFDLYIVQSAQMDLAALMAKGYCEPLSESAALSDFVAGTYPQLREAVSREGQPYFLPLSVSGGQGLIYYPDMFEAVGLSAPSDFEGLCDLLDNWNEGLNDQNPDHTPLYALDLRHRLSMLAIQLHQGECAAAGRDFSFEDPELVQMLRRVAALDTDDYAPTLDLNDPAALTRAEDQYQKAPLMDEGSSLDLDMLSQAASGGHMYVISFGGGPQHEVGTPLPLLLSARPGGRAHPGLDLTVMGVNPRSPRKEAALAYMDAYLAALGPTQRAALDPAWQGGVENEHYASFAQYMEGTLASLADQAAQAQGAEKRELEAQLKTEKERLGKEAEQSRWELHPEALRRYQQIMADSYVISGAPQDSLFRNPDIMGMLARFSQGQLSLPQMLREAEGKLRLMRLENQ